MTPEMRSQLGPIGAIAGAIALLALAVWTIQRERPAPIEESMLTSGDLWLDGGACPSRVELHFAVEATAPLAVDDPMLDRMAECLRRRAAPPIELGGLGVIDDARARSIVDALRARGVSPAGLRRVTYAEGMPLCDGDRCPPVEPPCPSHVALSFPPESYAPGNGASLGLDTVANCLTSGRRSTIALDGPIDVPRAREIAGELQQRGLAPDLVQHVTFGKGLALCLPSDFDCWEARRKAFGHPDTLPP